jgi:hypothetical protein
MDNGDRKPTVKMAATGIEGQEWPPAVAGVRQLDVAGITFTLRGTNLVLDCYRMRNRLQRSSIVLILPYMLSSGAILYSEFATRSVIRFRSGPRITEAVLQAFLVPIVGYVALCLSYNRMSGRGHYVFDLDRRIVATGDGRLLTITPAAAVSIESTQAPVPWIKRYYTVWLTGVSGPIPSWIAGNRIGSALYRTLVKQRAYLDRYSTPTDAQAAAIAVAECTGLTLKRAE